MLYGLRYDGGRSPVNFMAYFHEGKKKETNEEAVSRDYIVASASLVSWHLVRHSPRFHFPQFSPLNMLWQGFKIITSRIFSAFFPFLVGICEHLILEVSASATHSCGGEYGRLFLSEGVEYSTLSYNTSHMLRLCLTKKDVLDAFPFRYFIAWSLSGRLGAFR